MHSLANAAWVLPQLSTVSASVSQHLQQLGLKWRSTEQVREDFKGYLVHNSSGELLATGAGKLYSDSHLEIWSTVTHTLVLSHETDNSSSATLVWLADNRYLTGSNDSLIRLWNQGRCEAVLTGHRDWVRSMAISRGEERLLSGGMNGEIRLWDVGTLRGIDEMAVSGNAPMNSIQSTTFTANGTGCLAVTREGVLCGYDLLSHQVLFPSVISI